MASISVAKHKKMGLSQKLLIRLKAQPFTMQFCKIERNKRKKPQKEAILSTTEKRIAKILNFSAYKILQSWFKKRSV